MIRFFGGKVLALNGNFDITNDEVWIDANKIVYVGNPLASDKAWALFTEILEII